MAADLLKGNIDLKPRRTRLLTVACVLALMLSLWGMFSGALNYYHIEKDSAYRDARSAIERGQKALNWSDNENALVYNAENVKQSSAVSFFAHLLGFASTLLMLTNKRRGLYLYAVSAIILLLAPIVIFKSNSLSALLSFVPGVTAAGIALLLHRGWLKWKQANPFSG